MASPANFEIILGHQLRKSGHNITERTTNVICQKEHRLHTFEATVDNHYQIDKIYNCVKNQNGKRHRMYSLTMHTRYT